VAGLGHIRRDALGHTSEATTRRHYLGEATGQLVDMMSARRKGN
jgi:hypothetical protein